MDTGLLATIITAILAMLAAFGGVHKYVKKFVVAIKESTDVGNALNEVSKMIDLAIEDNIVEKSEIDEINNKLKSIKTEIDQAKEAWKNLFNKIS